MRCMFFGCRELVSLDLSRWTTASIPITQSGDYGLDQMFVSTPHLKEIKLGANFDPDMSPDRAAVFDAHTLKTNGTGWTGKWVNKDTGKSYTPAEIKGPSRHRPCRHMALGGTDHLHKRGRQQQQRGHAQYGIQSWRRKLHYGSIRQTGRNGVYESDEAFTITKTTIDDYTNKGPWDVTVSTEYVPYDQNSSNGWKLSAITLDANNQNANNTLCQRETRHVLYCLLCFRRRERQKWMTISSK